jgi:3-oxoacyl-[acyl-carrier-protein] synthase-3
MAGPPVALSAPAYALGELVPLERAAPEATDELRGRLREHGFVACSVADRPPSALAAEAVRALLAATGVAPGQVDAVVYGTCSYSSEPGTTLQAAVRDRVLVPLGLAAARLFGVWLAASGNLASVLRLACGLLATARCRTVLCVVADAVPDRPGEYRAMPNAVTVNGDGAAACLVSTRVGGPYRIEGVGQAASATMTGFGAGQALQKYLEIMTGVRRACERLYAATGQTADAYRWLVTNNYRRRTLEEFAAMARMPARRLFTGTIAGCGHVFAADGLINLAAVPAAAGDRVLVLSTGPFTWGAIGLVRTDAGW